jgi:hypothetical protein
MIGLIQDIVGLLGWPICAKDGCGRPAFCQIEFIDNNGAVWVHLCLSCIREIGPVLDEVSGLRAEIGQAAERDRLEEGGKGPREAP